MKRAKHVLAAMLSLALLYSMCGVAEEPTEAMEEVEFLEAPEEEAVEEFTEVPLDEPEPELEETVEEVEASEVLTEVPDEIAVEEEHPDAEGDFEIDESGVLVTYRGSDTDVTVPDGVKAIGHEAFSGNDVIETVYLPDGLTAICAYAFDTCSSLQTINIPDSVTYIDTGAFNSCSALQSISIPDGVQYLVEVFCDCTSLKTVSIPDSVTIIDDAFSGCFSLEAIDIPDGVTIIGDYTFYRCESLTSINIPAGVTRIEMYTFFGCKSLTSINIPAGITHIGESSFEECTALKTVTIPDTVKTIGRSAFKNCNSVETFVIPESVTGIGNYVFQGLTAAQSIYFPRSLVNISTWMLGNPEKDEISVQIYVYKGSPMESLCKENNIPYKYHTGGEDATISLPFSEKTLCVKETATVKPSTSGLKKKEKYSFTTSDANVAAVSKTSGKITAKNPGTATITATGKTSKQSASCTITVKAAPASLALNLNSESRNIGETVQLSASITPADAPQDVSWSISKKQKKYASVDEHGLVTALQEGKVTVTATAKHKNLKGKSVTAKFTLTIVDPKRPTAIQIDPETPKELVMTGGQQASMQLRHLLEPAETAESDVSWSIPKKAHRKIASITAQGLLTAKKAGTVSVKVTARKKSAAGKALSATMQIVIVDPTIPTSVTIVEPEGTQIRKGEKLTLHAACAPETAANAELEWTSSNKKVVKVNKATGEVTAVKPGKAKITAKAKKGGQKFTITVQVVQ